MKEPNIYWIIDCVSSILTSPRWEAEVLSFIDEYCIIFDDEEENKLEFTKVHLQFVSIVDTVLIERLHEVGISEEEFTNACLKYNEHCKNCEQVLDNSVVEQIYAMVDFQGFKAMMLKRNMELQIEAMEALTKINGCCKQLCENIKFDELITVLNNGEGESKKEVDEKKQHMKTESINLSPVNTMIEKREEKIHNLDSKDCGENLRIQDASSLNGANENAKEALFDDNVRKLDNGPEKIVSSETELEEKEMNSKDDSEEPQEDVLTVRSQIANEVLEADVFDQAITPHESYHNIHRSLESKNSDGIDVNSVKSLEHQEIQITKDIYHDISKPQSNDEEHRNTSPSPHQQKYYTKTSNVDGTQCANKELKRNKCASNKKEEETTLSNHIFQPILSQSESNTLNIIPSNKNKWKTHENTMMVTPIKIISTETLDTTLLELPPTFWHFF